MGVVVVVARQPLVGGDRLNEVALEVIEVGNGPTIGQLDRLVAPGAIAVAVQRPAAIAGDAQ
jgi:hypothetical protein